jgi:hypothetical protein
LKIILIHADDATPAALLAQAAGPGATVLCAPNASMAAQRLYPDRRIEVKALYAEPRSRGGLLGWMLRPRPDDEAAEAVKRRVIDCAVRLTQLAKSDQAASLVAGPRLLRLVAFKLGAIGWQGPLLRGFKPGEARHFHYGD